MAKGEENATLFAFTHIMADRIDNDVMSMSKSVIFKVKCEF